MRNVTRDKVLAWRAEKAADGRERRRGLIGRDMLREGEALVIHGCRQVHSFGMRFAIDLLFVDRRGYVVRALTDFKPWRLSPVVVKARTAVELPAGTIEMTGTGEGDRIELPGC